VLDSRTRLAAVLALTVGSLDDAIPEAVLRAVWESEREFLLATSADVAELQGFWRFEPGVPAELRAELPALYPVGDAERVERARAELRTRRRSWLAEHAPRLAPR
jgi:hypothetical protein